MVEPEYDFSLLILILGGVVLLTLVIRPALQHVGVPSLVGFLALGFLLRVMDSRWAFLAQEMNQVFEFLATVGVIFLLFRVGLESNLGGLRRQLKRASVVWLGEIVFSGVLGYVVSYFLLGLGLLPSLFVGIALTATSVAISIGVWQEAKAMKSPTGELVVDVAEMDDISAVILMAMLFAVVPILKGDAETTLGLLLAETVGLISVKLIGFGALCVLFSRYIEQPVTHFFKKMEKVPGQLLMIAGFGLIIAALAGLLGFSVAIGAFFAGLVFSRDPHAVKLDTPFGILYDFFTPFFFISIGLNIDPGTLTTGLAVGGALLGAAIVGKLVGIGGPALLTTGWSGALLLATSMVPRAEITLVIMQRGLGLGDWAVPSHVFGGVVLVAAVTSLLAPIALRLMLKRWPQS